MGRFRQAPSLTVIWSASFVLGRTRRTGAGFDWACHWYEDVILNPQVKNLGRGASGSHEVRVDVNNSAPPQTLRLRPQGDSKSARIRTDGGTGSVFSFVVPVVATTTSDSESIRLRREESWTLALDLSASLKVTWNGSRPPSSRGTNRESQAIALDPSTSLGVT